MSEAPQAKITPPRTSDRSMAWVGSFARPGITLVRPSSVPRRIAAPSVPGSTAANAEGSRSDDTLCSPAGYHDRYISPLSYETTSPNGPRTTEVGGTSFSDAVLAIRTSYLVRNSQGRAG